jgi:hypothetical protein
VASLSATTETPLEKGRDDSYCVDRMAICSQLNWCAQVGAPSSQCERTLS